MKLINLNLLCFLLLYFFNCLSSYADKGAVTKVSISELDIQPKVCSKNEQGYCELDILIYYKVDVTACIYINQVENRCWNKSNQGAFSYHFRGEDNLLIEVRDSADNVLDYVEFVVLKTDSFTIRRARRPWSLF